MKKDFLMLKNLHTLPRKDSHKLSSHLIQETLLPEIEEFQLTCLTANKTKEPIKLKLLNLNYSLNCLTIEEKNQQISKKINKKQKKSEKKQQKSTQQKKTTNYLT